MKTEREAVVELRRQIRAAEGQRDGLNARITRLEKELQDTLVPKFEEPVRGATIQWREWRTASGDYSTCMAYRSPGTGLWYTVPFVGGSVLVRTWEEFMEHLGSLYSYAGPYEISAAFGNGRPLMRSVSEEDRPC